MTDIINLNSIRSDNCDCNKPKPKENSCGCHNHKPQPCYLAVDLSDLYFKVKNLFSELKSEWQRAEARSNLGIIDILGLELTKESLESGGTNEWTMTTLKGGVTSVYKFYVKNGLRGETGPLGKSAYDIYCETTTDYPVKTLALWLISLKGDQGEVGPAGMSAYELAQKQRAAALLPILSLEEWLLSLKGEKGDKGDSGDGEGDKIVSVTLMSSTATMPEDAYIWRITLKSGQTFDWWVPKGGGSVDPVTPSGVPVIMYRKKHYDQKPTESTLAALLEDWQIEVNSGNHGKTIYELESLGWMHSASIVRENDFIFMASTIIVDDYVNPWTVVRLTPLDGNNGTSGDGTKGDFKSTAFTRTNKNISGSRPQGGDYGSPIPSSFTYEGESIIWQDGIPDIINGDAKVLWSTTRIFKGNGEDTLWSYPTKVLDTQTYDVEFSPYSNADDTAPQTTDNIENSNSWFDPVKDLNNLPPGKTWADMIWRAERHKDSQLGLWGSWVITRIKGEQGPQGPQGPEGPGGNGTGTLGLTGPVIRMRGEWQANANPCYVNESLLLLELDRIRFIDVVFYENNYYMVKNTTSGNCVNSNPTNTNDWEPASAFNFAYIQTLITQYLSTYTLDTEEVRIHSRSTNPVSDIIVAGMTSGKQAVEGETNIAGDVRIWAGSNVNVLNQPNGLYQLNVQGAPFRVTQSGHLFAEDADIEGTIRANTLMLGELSQTTHEGTFILPITTDNITLPSLEEDRILMFYILTNKLSENITVIASLGDDICDMAGTIGGSFTAYPSKLYQVFGINKHWYVIELGMQAVTPDPTTTTGNVVDPSFYTFTLKITIDDEYSIAPGQSNGSGYLLPKGTVELKVKNNYITPIKIWFPNLYLTILYDLNTQTLYDDPVLTYLISIPGMSISLNKNEEKNGTVAYGTHSGEGSYTNNIGLEVDYSELNDVSGFIQSTSAFVGILETDFATLDGMTITFLPSIASATTQGSSTIHATNPNGDNNENGQGNESNDGVEIPISFNHRFTPYLLINGENEITFGKTGNTYKFEGYISNAENTVPIAVLFPQTASINYYIKGTRDGESKVVHGGEIEFKFNHGDIENLEVLNLVANETDYSQTAELINAHMIKEYFIEDGVLKYFTVRIVPDSNCNIANYTSPIIWGYSANLYPGETTLESFDNNCVGLSADSIWLSQLTAYQSVPRSLFSTLTSLTQQNN